jgi:uncharacterized protein YjcR
MPRTVGGALTMLGFYIISQHGRRCNMTDFEKKIDTLENAVSQIKEFVVELRVFNQYSKEQNDKRDKLIDELISLNQTNERRIDKLEPIIENQNKILNTHEGAIKELQEERNFNTVKFASSKMPIIVTAGLTALVCSVLFSLIMFLKDLKK